MKCKQQDEWAQRLSGLEAIRDGNPSTIKEFEQLLHSFYPNVLEDWNTLNHWEKLRLVELIVKGSAKIMITH